MINKTEEQKQKHKEIIKKEIQMGIQDNINDKDNDGRKVYVLYGYWNGKRNSQCSQYECTGDGSAIIGVYEDYEQAEMKLSEIEETYAEEYLRLEPNINQPVSVVKGDGLYERYSIYDDYVKFYIVEQNIIP